MMWAWIILTAMISTKVRAQSDCDDCPTRKQCPVRNGASPESQLRTEIFCEYDRMLRPRVDLQSYINVTVRLDLKFVNVEDYFDVVTMHSWVVVEWKDEFLVWNPTNYDNIDQIAVPASHLWVPDLTLYNSAVSTNSRLIAHTTCVLYSTGQVVCTPEALAPLHCKLELQAWPYDIQNCTMYVGAWTFGQQRLNVMPANNAIVLDVITPNNGWTLLNLSVQRNGDENGEGWLEYQFVLKRQAAAHHAAIVLPAIAVTGLVLASFWIHHKQTVVRMMLCCVAMFLHILFIQYVGLMAPVSGDTSPTVVTFYRDAMALAGVALLLALMVLATDLDREPFPWLSRSMGFLLQWPTLCTLMSVQASEKENEEGTSAVVVTWDVLLTIIDRIAFLIFLVIHLVMLVDLIP